MSRPQLATTHFKKTFGALRRILFLLTFFQKLIQMGHRHSHCMALRLWLGRRFCSRLRDDAFRRKLHVLQAPKSSWPHQLPICEAKKSTARLARPQVRSPIIRESLFTCSLGAFIESRHFLMISSKANRNTSNMIPRLSKRDLTKTASPYVCTFGSTVLVLVKRTRTVDPKVEPYWEAFCVHDCNVSIIFCHVVLSLESVIDAARRHSSRTSTCKISVDWSFSDLFHFGGMPFKHSAPWSERSPIPHMCWKCEIHHGRGCMWFCLVMVASCWLLFVCLAYTSASNAHPNSGVGIKDDRPPNHRPSCPKNCSQPRSWRLVLACLHLFPPGRPARAIPTQISTRLHLTLEKQKHFHQKPKTSCHIHGNASSNHPWLWSLRRMSVQ